ncbi:hypothetical protein [Streptomyces sp. NPDC098781]|uniref:hypothetical protein n=1 Tax=Streptomyces sp. NPDC098781 TaxID=3366097 RepID=UPI0038285213
MPQQAIYAEELDYLVRYVRMAPLYFVPLRDAAERIAGSGSSETEVQQVTLRLIGDMLDQGVRIGDMSPRDGEGVLPWDLSKEDALARVADEMTRYEDPVDFIDICWFGVDAV